MHGEANMKGLSMGFKKTYTDQIRSRYLSASKINKARILDEYCHICGYTRKHAIRSLSSKPLAAKKKPKGPNPKYPLEVFSEPLGRIWLMANRPCSKHLVTVMRNSVSQYQATYGNLSSDIIKKLLGMSASTIDRILSNSRFKAYRKGISGTSSGSLLKEEIKLSDNRWDDKKPGYFEADTVAMCGDSIGGQFIWCLNMTDVATAWTEVRACWGKSSEAILNRLKEIERALPMPFLGFDSDNGSEFLNYKILEHLQKRDKPVQFTRSRPYQKNDNAHVEQKNYTHVRKFLGYYRYDKPELTQQINDLLVEWSKFKNFVIPCQKTVEKKRVGSRIKRIMDEPKTPYHRLLESGAISEKEKRILVEEYRAYNPFIEKPKIDAKLTAILKMLKVADQHDALH